MFGLAGIIILFVLVLLISSIKVLPEYQRGVMLTLGRYTGTKGPGLIIMIPVIQSMVRVDLRVGVMDVPPQDVISRDNVSVRVNAVVYYRVVESDKAVLQVADFYQATSQLAQTRLRSVLGQHELDEILSERESINKTLQQILDEATDPWGIKITDVEIKDVDLNETMVRAIARQAEAERERRAKVIHAEGEMQAAEKLRDAARHAGPAAAGDAAALPADPGRHGQQRQVQYHRLPVAAGPDQAADGRDRQGCLIRHHTVASSAAYGWVSHGAGDPRQLRLRCGDGGDDLPRSRSAGR